MIKNWLIYLGTLFALLVFSAFHGYETTTWNLFLLVMFTPVASLLLSLPLMIIACTGGVGAHVPSEIRQGDPAEILISSNKKPVIFPQLRFSVFCRNEFAHTKKRYRTTAFFGSSKRPFTIINHNLSEHCGCVTIELRRCIVCDFTGMFCIPVRFRDNLSINVMPRIEKPRVLPTVNNTQVLGYRPKPGGGFSDNYELRPYREGDSLKNIHWKISSKYDDLIVREPSLPILKDLIVRLDLTENADVNDRISARFMYAAEYLIEQKKPFFCLTSQGGCYRVENRDELRACLNDMFRNRPGSLSPNVTGAELYIIGADGEEVDGL